MTSLCFRTKPLTLYIKNFSTTLYTDGTLRENQLVSQRSEDRHQSDHFNRFEVTNKAHSTFTLSPSLLQIHLPAFLTNKTNTKNIQGQIVSISNYGSTIACLIGSGTQIRQWALEAFLSCNRSITGSLIRWWGDKRLVNPSLQSSYHGKKKPLPEILYKRTEMLLTINEPSGNMLNKECAIHL